MKYIKIHINVHEFTVLQTAQKPIIPILYQNNYYQIRRYREKIKYIKCKYLDFCVFFCFLWLFSCFLSRVWVFSGFLVRLVYWKHSNKRGALKDGCKTALYNNQTVVCTMKSEFDIMNHAVSWWWKAVF